MAINSTSEYEEKGKQRFSVALVSTTKAFREVVDTLMYNSLESYNEQDTPSSLNMSLEDIARKVDTDIVPRMLQLYELSEFTRKQSFNMTDAAGRHFYNVPVLLNNLKKYITFAYVTYDKLRTLGAEKIAPIQMTILKRYILDVGVVVKSLEMTNTLYRGVQRLAGTAPSKKSLFAKNLVNSTFSSNDSLDSAGGHIILNGTGKSSVSIESAVFSQGASGGDAALHELGHLFQENVYRESNFYSGQSGKNKYDEAREYIDMALGSETAKEEVRLAYLRQSQIFKFVPDPQMLEYYQKSNEIFAREVSNYIRFGRAKTGQGQLVIDYLIKAQLITPEDVTMMKRIRSLMRKQTSKSKAELLVLRQKLGLKGVLGYRGNFGNILKFGLETGEDRSEIDPEYNMSISLEPGAGTKAATQKQVEKVLRAYFTEIGKAFSPEEIAKVAERLNAGELLPQRIKVGKGKGSMVNVEEMISGIVPRLPANRYLNTMGSGAIPGAMSSALMTMPPSGIVPFGPSPIALGAGNSSVYPPIGLPGPSLSTDELIAQTVREIASRLAPDGSAVKPGEIARAIADEFDDGLGPGLTPEQIAGATGRSGAVRGGVADKDWIKEQDRKKFVTDQNLVRQIIGNNLQPGENPAFTMPNPAAPGLFPDVSKYAGVGRRISEDFFGGGAITSPVGIKVDDAKGKVQVSMRNAATKITSVFTYLVDAIGNAYTPEEMKALNKAGNEAAAAQKREDKARALGMAARQGMQQKFPNALEKLYDVTPSIMEDPKTKFKIKTETASGLTNIEASHKLASGELESARVVVDKYGRTMMDTSKRFMDFGMALKRNISEFFRWSLAVAVVYTPLQKLSELLKIAIQGQTELSHALVTLGESQSAANRVFQSAYEISQATGESLNGVIDGYNQAFRATGNIMDRTERYATANKLLTDSITLAKIGQMDQAAATDALVASLKQMNMPLDEGDKLLDKWVKTSRVANVDVQTLATSFSIVAEAATNAGLSVDDLNGLIATVAEVSTLGAREVGNATRAIISGYSSDNARNELAKFGIAITNAEGQARGFTDVFTQLKQLSDSGLISTDQMNKIALAIGNGNRRQAQVVATIANLDRMNEIAIQSSMAGGDAELALGTVLNTVATSVTRLANAFEQLAMGMGMEGGVLATVQKLTDLLTGALELITKVTKALGAAAPVLAILGGVRLAAGKERMLDTGSAWGGKLGGIAATGMYGIGQIFNPSLRGRAPIVTRTLGEDENGLQTYRATNINGIPVTSKTDAAMRAALEKAAIVETAEKSSRIITQKGKAAEVSIQNWLSKPENGAKIGAGMAAGFTGAMMAMNGQIGAGIATGAAGILATIFGGPTAGYITTAITSGITSALPQYRAEGFGQVSAANPANVEGVAAQKGLKESEDILKFMGMGNAAIGKFFLGGTQAINPGQTQQEAALTWSKTQAAYGRRNLGPEAMQKLIDKYQQAVGIKTLNNEEGSPEFMKYYDKSAVEANQAGQGEWLRRQYFDKGSISAREYKTKKEQVSDLPAVLPQYVAYLGGRFDLLGESVKNTTDAYKVFSDLFIKGSPEQIAAVQDIVSEMDVLASAIKAAEEEGTNFVEITDAMGKVTKITMAEAQGRYNLKQTEFGNVVERETGTARANAVGIPTIQRQDWTQEMFNKILAGAKVDQESIVAALEDQGKSDQALALRRDNANQLYYLRLIDGTLKEVKGVNQDSMAQTHDDLVELGKIQDVKKTGLSFMEDTSPAAWNTAAAQTAAQMPGLMAQLKALGILDTTDLSEGTMTAVLSNGQIATITAFLPLFQKLLEENNKLLEKSVDGIYNLPEGMSFWLPYSAWNYKGTSAGGAVADTGKSDPALNANTAALNALTLSLQDQAMRGGRGGITPQMRYPRGPRGQVGPDLIAPLPEMSMQDFRTGEANSWKSYEERQDKKGFWGQSPSEIGPYVGGKLEDVIANLVNSLRDFLRPGENTKPLWEQSSVEVVPYVLRELLEMWTGLKRPESDYGGNGGGGGGGYGAPMEAAMSVATMNVTTMNVGTQNQGVGAASSAPYTPTNGGIVPGMKNGLPNAAYWANEPDILQNLTDMGLLKQGETKVKPWQKPLERTPWSYQAENRDAMSAGTSQITAESFGRGINNVWMDVLKSMPSTEPLGAGAGASAGTSAVMPKVTTALQLTIDNNQQLYIDGRQLANILKTYIIQDLIRYDAGTGSVRKAF